MTIEVSKAQRFLTIKMSSRMLECLRCFNGLFSKKQKKPQRQDLEISSNRPLQDCSSTFSPDHSLVFKFSSSDLAMHGESPTALSSPPSALLKKKRPKVFNLRKNAITVTSHYKPECFDSPSASIKIKRHRAEQTTEPIRGETLPPVCVHSPH